MTVSILTAESHPLISFAIQTLIDNEQGLKSLGNCCILTEVVAQIERHNPNVLIISRYLSGKDSLAILAEIQAVNPELKIILLSEKEDGEMVLSAVRYNVKGIVLMDMALQLLIPCIRKVNFGGEWLERGSTRVALDILIKRGAQTDPIKDNLTPQEERIARLVAKGLSNKEIARKLDCSEGSIKSYLHRIYTKLNLKGRVYLAQLITYPLY